MVTFLLCLIVMTQIAGWMYVKNLKRDYKKLKGDAKCIRHWHDSGKDGMIVSKEHVFKLWETLNEIQ